MDDLLVLGVGGLIAAVVHLAASRFGQHMRRAHDAKYFPPAILRPVLRQEKDDVT
jgi:hypothetical protein